MINLKSILLIIIFVSLINFKLTNTSSKLRKFDHLKMNSNLTIFEYNLTLNKTFNDYINKLANLSTSTKFITSAKIFKEIESTSTKKKSEYLDIIFAKLQNNMAERCEYDKNPKLVEICPDYLKKLSTFGYLNDSHLKNQRLKDVEHMIINDNVISLLKKKCSPGEWCLDYLEETIPGYSHNIAKSLLRRHSKNFCLISSCYEDIKEYINNCVDSEVTKSVLSMVPELCQMNENSNYNQPCLEQSLHLMHVTIAAHFSNEINNNSSKPKFGDICGDNLVEKKICSKECRGIAYDMSKLDSCCTDRSLIKKFTPLRWYDNYYDKVEIECELPFTSICFEGKYLGINPNMVLIMLAVTVIFMTVFFMVIYIICCRKSQEIQQSNTDTYEYCKLNNDVEEDMMMSQTNRNDDLNRNNFGQNSFEIKNTNLPESDDYKTKLYIDTTQTEIRSLIN